MSFSKTLVYWYLHNKRDLPWRKTKNPYSIWLSEIILQQTRVNQGLEYYKKFLHLFPTIFDLAKADEQSVLKAWQGLGYYSRARNLHHTAKHVVNELNGIFPNTYNDLLKLKGIGDYTASAIASICFNKPTAVVDGNVYRVLARYFGIHTPINSSKSIKEFKEIAQELIDKKNPDVYNQAIMEFGAIQCKPKNPNCNVCPLNTTCLALQNKTIDVLPVKIKKTNVKDRFLNYLVLIDCNNKVTIEQRKKKGIWQGLYQFPLIESTKSIDLKELTKSEKLKTIISNADKTISQYNSKPILHKLSHQNLYTTFWIILTSKNNKESITWDELEKYPVPTLIHNFVQTFKTKA